mmetsp:Transcript_34193/g.82894  ORF Transcript_34193/g.82894 Transcript_34193/m.82894 type:complete len:268 (-) Transcript_34193:1396-2199(-)
MPVAVRSSLLNSTKLTSSFNAESNFGSKFELPLFPTIDIMWDVVSSLGSMLRSCMSENAFVKSFRLLRDAAVESAPLKMNVIAFAAFPCSVSNDLDNNRSSSRHLRSNRLVLFPEGDASMAFRYVMASLGVPFCIISSRSAIKDTSGGGFSVPMIESTILYVTVSGRRFSDPLSQSLFICSNNCIASSTRPLVGRETFRAGLCLLRYFFWSLIARRTALYTQVLGAGIVDACAVESNCAIVPALISSSNSRATSYSEQRAQATIAAE